MPTPGVFRRGNDIYVSDSRGHRTKLDLEQFKNQRFNADFIPQSGELVSFEEARLGYDPFKRGMITAKQQAPLIRNTERALFGPRGLPEIKNPELAEANEPFKDTLNALETVLKEQLKKGSIVNPHIEITHEKTIEFLTKAEGEIQPFFRDQLKVARQQFLSELGYGKETILDIERQAEQTYQQQLRQLGEQAAESGLALSGRRQLAEQELAQGTQADIDQRRRQLMFGAQQAAGQFAGQFGRQALPDLTITSAPRVLAGKPQFERTRDLPFYELSPEVYGSLTGSETFRERAAVQARQANLERGFRGDEVLKRLYSSYQ